MTGPTGLGVDAVERARRADVVEQVRASAALEGVEPSPQLEAELARYIRGEISGAELGALVAGL